MSASGSPIMLALSVDSAGGVMDFEQAIEAVAIANNGPNTVYAAFGASIPTASVGNGRYAIPSGGYLNLDDLKAQKIAFRCAAAETAEVQAVGIPVGRVAIGPFGMAVNSGGGQGSSSDGAPPPIGGGGQVVTIPKDVLPLIIVTLAPNVTTEYGPFTINLPNGEVDLKSCKTLVCTMFDYKAVGGEIYIDEIGETIYGALRCDIYVEAQFDGGAWVSIAENRGDLIANTYSWGAEWQFEISQNWFGSGSTTKPTYYDVTGKSKMTGLRYRLEKFHPVSVLTIKGVMTLGFSPTAFADAVEVENPQP